MTQTSCRRRDTLHRALALMIIMGAALLDAGALCAQGRLGAQELPMRADEPLVRTWMIPAAGARAPSLSLLPGEEQAMSRSIGDVSYGYLVRAHHIGFPHPSLAMLERQSSRDLNYTSDAMFEAVEAASRHVQDHHPLAITYLGNFSAQGGGDIPYSVSHNSGRDADVAFFVLDEESGEPFEMRDLLALNEEGRYVPSEEDKSPFKSERVLTFDTARNWRFIEGLMLWGGLDGKIQYVFVSTPLKRMLLEYARGEGEASQDVIRAAERILIQPRSALPHNDHFHLRLYCTRADVVSGCVERGTKQPGYTSHLGSRAKTLARARAILEQEEPHGQEATLAAIERLALLKAGPRDSAPLLAYLTHESPRIRAATARALAMLRRGDRELSARLDLEEHPRVIAELIAALGALNRQTSYRALARLLKAPIPLDGLGEAGGAPMDGRVLIVEQLATAQDKAVVEPLVALFSTLDAASDEADTRQLAWSAHRALRMLTNQDPLVGEDGEAISEEVALVATLDARWQVWWAAHKEQTRRQWLLKGFERAGYDVEAIAKNQAWPLCRAVGAPERHVSYNAQRALMELFGHEPLSLEWSREDASFYWRRWLERRARRFRLPRIPQELSTLKK